MDIHRVLQRIQQKQEGTRNCRLSKDTTLICQTDILLPVVYSNSRVGLSCGVVAVSRTECGLLA